MRVSVVIDNYNYAAYLAEAVDSALAEDPYEVIVVDDGSTDGSAEVLDRYRDRVKVLEQANGGQASAFTAGISTSSGDVVCLLDSDDVFLPGKLAGVVDALSRSDAGVMCHRMRRFDAGGIIDDGDELPASGDYRGGRVPDLPATSALAFRRWVLDEVMPVPAALRVTADNYLKVAGLLTAPLVSVDEVWSAQRIHDSNLYTRRDRDTPEYRARYRAVTIDVAAGVARIDRRWSRRAFAGVARSAVRDGDWRQAVRAIARVR